MKNFKTVVRKLGYDNARFHDLRHSYAVASIKSGDDIKMEKIFLSVSQ